MKTRWHASQAIKSLGVRYLWLVLSTSAILLGLTACWPFAPSRSVSLTMGIEDRSNGYLVHIVTSEPVGEVSTVITTGNWLLITIADSMVTPPSLEAIHSPLVDSLEATTFPSATQLSLHLTMAVDAVDVIHDVPSSDIMISLFVRNSRPERR